MLAMLQRRRPPHTEHRATDLPALADLVKVLTLALARGEMGVDLHEASPPPEPLQAEGWPQAHRRALLNSGWLEEEPALMVLDGDRLHWRRWHKAMKHLEDTLVSRSSLPPLGGAGMGSSPQARSDPPQPPADLNAEQLAAVEAVSRHRVILLSGGPGTGKTSTVRFMLLRAMAERENLRIRLAAPTGKAARRLQESLRSHPHTAQLVCTTIHRLLQARPGGFGRNRRQPLPLDLLVVDEMSMVDLSLGQALLDALPPEAQLLLVGDANQLPPIGIGAVWQHLQQTSTRQRFGPAAIALHRVYRNRGDLALLSGLLRQEGLEPFWQKLRSLKAGGNIRLETSTDLRIPVAVVQVLREQLDHLQRGARSLAIEGSGHPDPEQAAALLDRLDQRIVLCPRRRGAWGVDALHHQLVEGRHAGEWPEGLPVLCSENQAELGLANGDLGICIGTGSTRRVLFRCSNDDGISRFNLLHPARIRHLEPALALTVHKAQGSEVEEVLLLWPTLDDPDGTALLYTALTRARRHLQLFTLRRTSP